MTDREAQEIVRMVESNWRFDLGSAARKMWRDELYGFLPELGVAAVSRLAKTQSKPPALADLLSMMRHMMADERTKKPAIPEPKSSEPPEWVYIWGWCRNVREPRFMFSFPQQEGNVDPANIMDAETFDRIRQEWIDAGSPRRDPLKWVLA